MSAEPQEGEVRHSDWLYDDAVPDHGNTGAPEPPEELTLEERVYRLEQ